MERQQLSYLTPAAPRGTRSGLVFGIASAVCPAVPLLGLASSNGVIFGLGLYLAVPIGILLGIVGVTAPRNREWATAGLLLNVVIGAGLFLWLWAYVDC